MNRESISEHFMRHKPVRFLAILLIWWFLEPKAAGRCGFCFSVCFVLLCFVLFLINTWFLMHQKKNNDYSFYLKFCKERCLRSQIHGLIWETLKSLWIWFVGRQEQINVTFSQRRWQLSQTDTLYMQPHKAKELSPLGCFFKICLANTYVLSLHMFLAPEFLKSFVGKLVLILWV